MDDLTAMGDLIRNSWVEVGAVIGLVVLVWAIRRLMSKKGSSRLFQPAHCIDCGWSGQVSRYAGRCPQCNRPLGEQKARRRP